MSNSDSLSNMSKAVINIAKKRGWQKFHTPKNMAMDLVREASEVLDGKKNLRCFRVFI